MHQNKLELSDKSVEMLAAAKKAEERQNETATSFTTLCIYGEVVGMIF